MPVPTIDSATATGDGLPVDAVIAESAPAQVPLPGDDATTAETNAATGKDPIVPSGDAITDDTTPQAGKPCRRQAGRPKPARHHRRPELSRAHDSFNRSAGQRHCCPARASGLARAAEAQAKKSEAAATDTPAVVEADAANGAAPTTEANGAKPQHKTEAVAAEGSTKPETTTKPANERTSATPVDPFATRTRPHFTF